MMEDLVLDLLDLQVFLVNLEKRVCQVCLERMDHKVFLENQVYLVSMDQKVTQDYLDLMA